MLTCQVLLKACREKIQPVLHEFQCESCAAFRDEAETQSRGGGNRRFARAKEKKTNQHERSDQTQLPRNEGNNLRRRSERLTSWSKVIMGSASLGCGLACFTPWEGVNRTV